MWWRWLIFWSVIVIFPIAFYNLACIAKRGRNLTEKQKKILAANAIKYTLFYWFCDLFFMSFIIDNLVCKFIFGGLVVLIVLYNLSMAFLKQTVKNGNKLLKLGLLQDFVVGIGMSIWLIYLIPDSDLQTIAMTMVAAVYGGLFTLVGVAWTIRKGDKDRKEDLQRLENERKEEERRKYSPVFSVVNKNIDMEKCVFIALDDVENIDKIVIQSDDTDNIRLQPIRIENSSKVEFYVYGFLFDDEFYAAPEKFLIKKDYYFVVHFLKALRFARNYEISLCIEDLIENKYSVKLSSVIKDNAMYMKGNGQLQLMEKK